MALTKEVIQEDYPEVFESYTMQIALTESKYEEKMKFWEEQRINCFEKWTVPYFLKRELEKKRPCLRLNYPIDGTCNDCVKRTCRYDRICFMCGLEGHGAFQSFPGGRMRGEFKCSKHRFFLNQMNEIREKYDLEDEDIRSLFKDSSLDTDEGNHEASKSNTDSSTEYISPIPNHPVNLNINPIAAAASFNSNIQTAGVLKSASALTTSVTAASAAPVQVSKSPRGMISSTEIQNNFNISPSDINIISDDIMTTGKTAVSAILPPSSLGLPAAPTATTTPPSALPSVNVFAPPPPQPQQPQTISAVLLTPPRWTGAGYEMSSAAESQHQREALSGGGPGFLYSGINDSNILGNSVSSSRSSSISRLGNESVGEDTSLNYFSSSNLNLLGSASNDPHSNMNINMNMNANTGGLSWSGTGTGTPKSQQIQQQQQMQMQQHHMQQQMQQQQQQLHNILSQSNQNNMMLPSLKTLPQGPGQGQGVYMAESTTTSTTNNNSNKENKLRLSPPSAHHPSQLQLQQLQQHQQQHLQSPAAHIAAALGSVGGGGLLSPGLLVNAYEMSDMDEMGTIPIMKLILTPVNMLKSHYSSSSSTSSSTSTAAAITATAAITSTSYGSQQNTDSNNNTCSIMTFRATMSSRKSLDDVAVLLWRPNPQIQIDMNTLKQEIKILRQLSARCVNHVSRILHKGVMEIQYPAGSCNELHCIVSEYSDFGYLDRYFQEYSSHLHSPGFGFANDDILFRNNIQAMSVQLIDGLMRFHELGISHKDIRPSNILVCRGTKLQPKLTPLGLFLKYSDFKLHSLSAANVLLGGGDVPDQWCAPEVNTEIRTTCNGYSNASDVWSLGCLIYYISTGGELLFDNHRQACESAVNGDIRKKYLERHGVHEKYPVLFDLIERFIRPLESRISLNTARCHPFLWNATCRKSFIVSFAQASSSGNGNDVSSEQQQPVHVSSAEKFMSTFDKFCMDYVFTHEGWFKKMPNDFKTFIQPMKLATDYFWSGNALLQVMRYQLLHPDMLHNALYSSLTPHQMLSAYLHQMLDIDFPRLLIVIFELGLSFGNWQWDGEDIIHTWK